MESSNYSHGVPNVSHWTSSTILFGQQVTNLPNSLPKQRTDFAPYIHKTESYERQIAPIITHAFISVSWFWKQTNNIACTHPVEGALLKIGAILPSLRSHLWFPPRGLPRPTLNQVAQSKNGGNILAVWVEWVVSGIIPTMISFGCFNFLVEEHF